jgi:hypothetical protein
MQLRAISRAVALTAVLIHAGPARAEPAKCRAAIIKASASFVQAEARALRRCREQIVRGKLPPGTDCLAHLPTANALARAGDKLRARITKACGGRDRACGTADDDPLADIGWDIGSCPSLAGASCEGPIASCADVATCLECLGDAAVDQSLEVVYGLMAPTDPKTQKDVNRCQVTLGRSVEKFLRARSKSLSRCWGAVNAGKADAPCPDPGDGKALAALDRAEQKTAAAICKACGGDDRACGGGDDLNRANIGFLFECSTVPACDRSIGSLEDIVACVDCVAASKGDCADRAAVPGLGSYPDECAPPPPPTLDYSLPPNYGSTSLTSGFVPDPHTVGITSGGPVDVSYLGGGCSGFATSAPDFSVNYTSGAFPTLRFYFIGSGDTTMIINAPNGSYSCVDDSFGTLNPTLDFNSPSSGRYDVWIASYASGTFISGTLYVTESTGNHP